MHIFFIRHGETTGDVEGRYGGAYDDHLTEHGFTQSEALATSLQNAHLQALYVSPLARARETADILMRAFGLSASVVKDFCERNQYGILSGVTKEEARVAHPDMVEALKDRMNTIEGAESYEAFRDRIREGLVSTLELARSRGEERIGIVWHGALCASCSAISSSGESSRQSVIAAMWSSSIRNPTGHSALQRGSSSNLRSIASA